MAGLGQLDYIVPLGQGPFVVLEETSFLGEKNKTYRVIKAFDSRTGNTVTYASASKADEQSKWRPLMTPAKARNVRILLDEQIEVPRWKGPSALKKVENAATRSLDVDEQIAAYLHTAPPPRGKMSPKIQEYRNKIKSNLAAEVELVLEEENKAIKKMMEHFEAKPKTNPSHVEDASEHNARILAAVERLAAEAGKKKVANNQKSYLMNHSQRLALLAQLV